MQLPVNYNTLKPYQKRQVREAYIELQEGMCCYCKMPLVGQPPAFITKKWINRKLFPEGFFEHPVHLHHDHDTGLTIGAVHNTCNAVLWQYYGE